MRQNDETKQQQPPQQQQQQQHQQQQQQNHCKEDKSKYTRQTLTPSGGDYYSNSCSDDEIEDKNNCHLRQKEISANNKHKFKCQCNKTTQTCLTKQNDDESAETQGTSEKISGANHHLQKQFKVNDLMVEKQEKKQELISGSKSGDRSCSIREKTEDNRCKSDGNDGLLAEEAQTNGKTTQQVDHEKVASESDKQQAASKITECNARSESDGDQTTLQQKPRRHLPQYLFNGTTFYYQPVSAAMPVPQTMARATLQAQPTALSQPPTSLQQPLAAPLMQLQASPSLLQPHLMKATAVMVPPPELAAKQQHVSYFVPTPSYHHHFYDPHYQPQQAALLMLEAQPSLAMTPYYAHDTSNLNYAHHRSYAANVYLAPTQAHANQNMFWQQPINGYLDYSMSLQRQQFELQQQQQQQQASLIYANYHPHHLIPHFLVQAPIAIASQHVAPLEQSSPIGLPIDHQTQHHQLLSSLSINNQHAIDKLMSTGNESHVHHLISKLPIDSQPARERQSYGMDKVWQDEFEQLFSQFVSNIAWTLVEVESNPNIRQDSDRIIAYEGRFIVRASEMSTNFNDPCLFMVHGDASSSCDTSGHGTSLSSSNSTASSSSSTSPRDRQETSTEDRQLESDSTEKCDREAISAVAATSDSVIDAGMSCSSPQTTASLGGDADEGEPTISRSISAATGQNASSASLEESVESPDSIRGETTTTTNDLQTNVSKQQSSHGKPFSMRFRMFIDSAKVRFCCDICGHGWTSMKGRVVFWYEIFEMVDDVSVVSSGGDDEDGDDDDDDVSGSMMASSSLPNAVHDVETKEIKAGTLVGYCAYKLFGQQCDVCKVENRFERPMWYPEEVTKVLNNLYNKIGQVYFGFKMPSIDRQRRAGKPKTSHNSSLCQACHDGVCTDRK